MKVKKTNLENKYNTINDIVEEKKLASLEIKTKNAAGTTTSTVSTPATTTSPKQCSRTNTNTNPNTKSNESKDENEVDLVKDKDEKVVDLTATTLKVEMDQEESKPPTRSSSVEVGLDANIKQDTEDGSKVIEKTDVKVEQETTDVSPKAVAGTGGSKAVGKKKRSAIVDDLEISDEEHYNRLKRRKIKVAGAPKLPLTGYVRYMNERREVLKKEHPNKTASEHTRMISEEWHQLSEDIKSPYINAAAIDKQRYEDELNVFLKANPNVLANELAKNKLTKTKASDNKASVLKEKSLSSENLKVPAAKELKGKQSQQEIKPPNAVPQNEVLKNLPVTTNGIVKSSENCSIYSITTPGEIPIFTNEFLEHNKIFDSEFRTLRKSKLELEQENSVLEQHVENMKVGVKKMTEENIELQEKNKFLEIYLEKLKKKLAKALAGLALPNEPHSATEDNIEEYLEQLYGMATSNSHGPACLNKAKDILRKLDMQIQL